VLPADHQRTDALSRSGRLIKALTRRRERESKRTRHDSMPSELSAHCASSSDLPVGGGVRDRFTLPRSSLSRPPRRVLESGRAKRVR